MARIAESELERLKAETSLARLIEETGIRLEKRGQDLVGPCPFHPDDTPSLTVTPAKNLFHCFGCRLHIRRRAVGGKYGAGGPWSGCGRGLVGPWSAS